MAPPASWIIMFGYACRPAKGPTLRVKRVLPFVRLFFWLSCAARCTMYSSLRMCSQSFTGKGKYFAPRRSLSFPQAPTLCMMYEPVLKGKVAHRKTTGRTRERRWLCDQWGASEHISKSATSNSLWPVSVISTSVDLWVASSKGLAVSGEEVAYAVRM